MAICRSSMLNGQIAVYFRHGRMRPTPRHSRKNRQWSGADDVDIGRSDVQLIVIRKKTMGSLRQAARWIVLVGGVLLGLLYLNGAAGNWWISWG
ncbi:MAG: hypothetical protein M0R77_13830, partial [Gammaproteobacteria bacterium]|nr:hypothetical protein [Gammaproteobacteria bacterium]